jgi:sortase (surface protein transpeptidase)
VRVSLVRLSVAAVVAAIVLPLVPVAPDVARAAPPKGASAFQAVTPTRLADTRPGEQGSGGFTRVNANTIRVQVTGRAGIPAGATAAVLNIASVNAQAAAFVTAFPAGNPLPTAASLNVDWPGRVIANLATVQLSSAGAVDLYSNQPMDLVIDVAGAYVPVSDGVASGRLVTVSGGARRVLDTRETGNVFSAGETQRVDLNVNGLAVPADATAVVVNLAAIDAVPGFWTAFPIGPRPFASSLNIDEVGQTRNSQGIVALSPGERAFDVYALNGGHLAVDVVGYFTGTSSVVTTDGLFVSSSPIRMLDTRYNHALAPWGGTTIEFSSGADLNVSAPVAAVAMNIAITDPWSVGFVTAYPAGSARPLAANLNVSKLGQIISNHAISRVGTRGVALYTQNGTQMIVDVTGWYLGAPDPSPLPVPVSPSTVPTTAVRVEVPSGRISTEIRYSPNVDAVVDSGRAVLYGGNGIIGGPDHNIFFAHRTEAGGPFRYIDRVPIGAEMIITGADGRRYRYEVVNRAVIWPIPSVLLETILATGASTTVTLVACTPPGSTAQRILVTGRLTGLAT